MSTGTVTRCPATEEAVQRMHPEGPELFEELSRWPAPPSVQVHEDVVLWAVRSFKKGSAGGSDGCRPMHIRHALIPAKRLSNTATPVAALTALCNLQISGCAPRTLAPYLAGGGFVGLQGQGKPVAFLKAEPGQRVRLRPPPPAAASVARQSGKVERVSRGHNFIRWDLPVAGVPPVTAVDEG